MWTMKTATLLVILGVTLVNAFPKEEKPEQNSLNYQIDPQLLNYHLQQLLLQQDQQNKQQTAQSTVQIPAQQFSVSDNQDETKYQQTLLQQQIQAQLAQQQLALQYQLQNDGKTAQTISTPTQAPPSNSLTISPYQGTSVQYQPSNFQQSSQPQYQDGVQYQIELPQQYQEYQLGSVKPYQLSTTSQEYQTTSSASLQSVPEANQVSYQQPQPQAGLEQYQSREPVLPQNTKQKVLGVSYSSAVDASKTHFTGYGIKYSF